MGLECSRSKFTNYFWALLISSVCYVFIVRMALESSLFQRAALRTQPAAGVSAVDRTAAARPARRGDGASRRGSRLSGRLVSRTESEAARDRLALLARLCGEDPQNLDYMSCYFAKKNKLHLGECQDERYI